MKNYILKCQDVIKTYKDHKVLDNVSINIEKGDIYGFVGKNGAGKTTLIRIILGLVNCDSGKIQLFCNTDKEKINLSKSKIGSLIEKPIFYENMTARENLELILIQKGKKNTSNIDIDEILELVNLHNIDNKKSKNFSLGMKQRLGIAMSILDTPELLILDEPINGLDPIGIKEIRELLINLNRKYGTTILISSHILSELSLLANKFGFINQGKLIKELSFDKLQDECRSYLHVKVSSTSNIDRILKEQFNVKDYEILEDKILKIYDNINLENFSHILSKNNIAIFELFEKKQSLEDYFSNLIGGCYNE